MTTPYRLAAKYLAEAITYLAMGDHLWKVIGCVQAALDCLGVESLETHESAFSAANRASPPDP